MVNKGANIDLLFRNGLKDYEVLPPVNVWNNIVPVIRKRQRAVILLRSAAFIAVMLSISFLAYRWSQEFVSQGEDQGFVLADGPVRLRNSGTGQANTSGIVIPEVSTKAIKTDQDPGSGSTDELSAISAPAENPDEQQITQISGQEVPPVTINSFKNLNLSSSKSTFDNSDPVESSYDIPKEKGKRWTILALASPTYYMTPEVSGTDVSRQVNSLEQSRISYTGGVGFAYRVTRKLSVQSGLYYSSLGNEVDNINSFAGFRQYDYTKGDHNFEVLTSNGLIYTDNADVFLLDNSGDRVLTMYTKDVFDPTKANLSYINNTLFQNFSYLEMPLILRYKVIDKSLDINLIGGLSYNLLINNSVHTVIDGNRYNIGKTEGLNPLMISSALGMGMEYNLSNRFSVNLEPTFRYYLNPFGDFSGIRSHPYSFGIFSGLSYKF